jgi:hypothetical protein
MKLKESKINVGDTIELLAMDDDLSKLKPGSRGTVSSIDSEQDLIWVDWENGEKLALLKGIDKFRKIKK